MTIKTFLLGAACAFLFAAPFSAQAASAGEQRSYDSPEVAAEALATATKANDKAELLAILGGGAKDLISSGDEVADNAERAAFAQAYAKRHELISDELMPAEASGKAPERRILEIGENRWPFPVPLIKDAKTGRWVFDGEAGLEEILDRRVGRNELSAMEVCQAYVDAQYDYYRLNPDKGPVPHFAQKITSTPGKRDGLYWEAKEGEPPSPLGSLMAAAAQSGYTAQRQGDGAPYHGYRYKVLTAQGKHARNGAYSYVENGLMFGGFALVAYPDKYGVSGVMTFMVSQDGIIYEKNLGRDTAVLAQKISLFDPDNSWKKVGKDELPVEE